MCSAALPLDSKYCIYIVFKRNVLKVKRQCDTMNRRCKSMYGDKYSQVFENNAYFSKVYPKNLNIKAWDALNLLFQEFGVPWKLTFDGFKEQSYKGTTFIKEVHSQVIDYHISDPEYQNYNPVEGVIQEVRRKWCHTMLKKRETRQLWDYGVIWVSDMMSMTRYLENSDNRGITLTNLTVDTLDNSDNPKFGFYEKFCFKDNYGMSNSEYGRWLGISHQTRRLMRYHILTHTGKVISR